MFYNTLSSKLNIFPWTLIEVRTVGLVAGNMWQTIMLVSLIASTGAVRDNSRSDDRSNEDFEDAIFFSRKETDRIPTTTTRYLKGDVVVEKFLETLMSSEKYLKMIESVERKLNHLDATFHERTNSILKYVSEMLRTMKSAPAEVLQTALKTVKSDLDTLKQSVAERLDYRPTMRVEGAELHADAALDTRLTSIDGQLKTIMAGVESIVNIISEVKNRQYSRTYQKSDTGNSPIDSMNLINEFRKTIHDSKTRRCECKSGRVDRSERYPTDCHEIQMQGFNVSGIYKIKPDDMEPFYALCDLTTAGGGWTVFQNRFDGSQDFYKGWSEYRHGFGNLAGEFWLGLEKLNYLTNQKLYELRVEVETQHGQAAYAGYSVFTVGPELEGFRISTLGTYYGTAGDSLSYHAGQKFSTIDADNDEWKDGACATEHGGAWWYKECDKSNLNGKYTVNPEEHRGQSIYWISFKGPSFPLSKTKMMIRPLPASRPAGLTDQTRTILERSKLKPQEEEKSLHPKEAKSERHVHKHSPYRLDGRTDVFFPNYT